jgi:hypothetical protein
MKSLTESQVVPIPVQDHVIHGDLAIPTSARALVIFALSGSDRQSPLQYVARVLNDGGIATLLVDLLTSEEEHTDFELSHLRFDISLLATGWLQPATGFESTGIFPAHAWDISAQAPAVQPH